MGLEFGIGFGQDESVHDIAEHCRHAEQLGFTHATMIDMGTLSQEVHVLMTLAALETSSIKIGHGVTNPATYHPGAVANAMASLRELAGDRLFVGLGAGGPYGQFLKKGVRMSELAEAIRFMIDYSAGRDARWSDGSWHSEWIRGSRFNGRHVPVWLAIAGPKTSQMGGEVADAVFSIGMDPELQRWRRDQIALGAERSGRDPADVEHWVRTQVYIAESKAAAMRETAPYAATATWELYQILRRRTPDGEDLRKRIEKRHPGLIEEFKQIYDHWDPYWTERIGGPQTEFVTQRVIDFFLATGTVDDVNEQIAALVDVGVKGISSVAFSISNQFEMMERIHAEVMPRFQ